METFPQIYQRYLAATTSRDADAVAALFTVDGVFEAPLQPAGTLFPGRLEGREAIRVGLGMYYREAPADERTVSLDKTRFVVHATADPAVWIVEIDTVFESGETIALVQIFRLRDGEIAMLRDYFGSAVLG